MNIRFFTTLDELRPYAADWDRLAAGVPFRGWAWVSTWWNIYGPEQETSHAQDRLFVFGVFDTTGRLVGLTPWYVKESRARGRVVRPLGSGEVCSDYLSVFCQRGLEGQVAESLAERLTEMANGDGSPQCWDLLELTGFDAEDRATNCLLREMEERGNWIDCRPGPNCWRIALPETWDDYLAMLSKNRRKQIRRLQRDWLDTGRAVLHNVQQRSDLNEGLSVLVDLHQKRRRSLGEPGCFASKKFDRFHREVMPRLLSAGQLRLSWLELDGRPAATEYQLGGQGVIYAYQGGLAPELAEQAPGTLITAATLRQAIERGYRVFDFLRGDEPYKAYWQAKPRESLEARIVPDRTDARWRHNLWRTGSQVKRWIKVVTNRE